jgi:hypothetical protein
MITRLEPDLPPSGERVHLEQCKICGEWINRLNLEQVVQHLDHSRVPTGDQKPVAVQVPPDRTN